jgi:hypothetical protein
LRVADQKDSSVAVDIKEQIKYDIEAGLSNQG